MRRTLLAAGLAAAALLPVQANAARPCTEAKDLLDKAVAHIAAVGKPQALADFTATDKGFVIDDLYIITVDMEGTWIAIGSKPQLVGKSAAMVKDKKGKLLVQEWIQIAKGPGEGISDYYWPNPETSKVEQKRTYVKRVDDMIVSSGCYMGQ